MAQQIIITKDNFGINISSTFLDINKNPIDLTGKTVEVVIVDPNNITIDVKQGVIADSLSGTSSIILESLHTSMLGLYKTFWSLIDSNGLVTAQDDIFYYVKEKNNGSSSSSETGFDKVNTNAEIIEARQGSQTLSENISKVKVTITENKSAVDSTINSINNNINNLQSSINNKVGEEYVNTKVDESSKQISNNISSLNTSSFNYNKEFDYYIEQFGQSTSRKVIIGTDNGVKPSIHRAFPSLVKVGNKLICVYREGANHVSFDGIIKQVTSTDGGANWSSPTVIAQSSGNDIRDPFLHVAKNGDILLFATHRASNENREIKVYKSTDGCSTWVYKSSIPQATGYNAQPQIRGTIENLDDGTILAPIYYQTIWGVYLVSSKDNGDTWSFYSWITKEAYNETAICRTKKNNQLIAVLRQSVTDIKTGNGAVSISNDNGLTWSVPFGTGITIQAPTLTKYEDKILLTFRNPNTSSNKRSKHEIQMVVIDANNIKNILTPVFSCFWTSNSWDMAYQDIVFDGSNFNIVFYYPEGENISYIKLPKVNVDRINYITHYHVPQNKITVINSKTGNSEYSGYYDIAGIAFVNGTGANTASVTVTYPFTVQRTIAKGAVISGNTDGNYNVSITSATNNGMTFLVKHIGGNTWSSEREISWFAKVILN